MPSVIEAAIKSAEARSSFSPLALENRSEASTHISSGIMQMRISVMEFGRFTYRAAVGDFPRRPKLSSTHIDEAMAPKGLRPGCQAPAPCPKTGDKSQQKPGVRENKEEEKQENEKD